MKTLKINKNTFLFLATILLTSQIQAQSWFGNKIKGNGNVTTISRTTSDYDAIACAGSFDYVLVKGTEGKITIEGESNLLEHIITEVKGDKLYIKTENNVNISTSRNKTIKITIPFQDISKVSLAGSGDLWNTDEITADNLSVSLAGSGDISLDISASTVESNLAGSGDIVLKGKTTNLETNVTGSGDFEGFALQAENTEANVTGSGDAEVVSTSKLKARVTGSGDIEYKGNPKKEDTKVAGSGSISMN